jgi:hypothetical protein
MDKLYVVAIIAAAPATISALTAAVVGLHNRNKLTALAVSIDGQLAKLLAGASAEGQVKERDEQRAQANVEADRGKAEGLHPEG